MFWDNLNEYALHLHYDHSVNSLLDRQQTTLTYFPDGLLTEITIQRNSINNNAVVVTQEIAQFRDDIHSVQNISLPLNEDVPFTVALDPKIKTIFVGENQSDGKAWKITGFDLDLKNLLGRDTFNKISDPFKVSPERIFSSLHSE